MALTPPMTMPAMSPAVSPPPFDGFGDEVWVAVVVGRVAGLVMIPESVDVFGGRVVSDRAVRTGHLRLRWRRYQDLAGPLAVFGVGIYRAGHVDEIARAAGIYTLREVRCHYRLEIVPAETRVFGVLSAEDGITVTAADHVPNDEPTTGTAFPKATPGASSKILIEGERLDAYNAVGTKCDIEEAERREDNYGDAPKA
ncbi:hypothetical protein H2200_012640 [Cladophialophora chaetospira]|uniref:Uncharacterized protein n=1 Tax=Cladophialophora chaetospira TaxID=386627 RepID=A0AA38WXA6_9EURO|nr:hypothetical protein H2200_012640 [Cladophialophora chaetospira]